MRVSRHPRLLTRALPPSQQRSSRQLLRAALQRVRVQLPPRSRLPLLSATLRASHQSVTCSHLRRAASCSKGRAQLRALTRAGRRVSRQSLALQAMRLRPPPLPPCARNSSFPALSQPREPSRSIASSSPVRRGACPSPMPREKECASSSDPRSRSPSHLRSSPASDGASSSRLPSTTGECFCVCQRPSARLRGRRRLSGVKRQAGVWSTGGGRHRRRARGSQCSEKRLPPGVASHLRGLSHRLLLPNAEV